MHHTQFLAPEGDLDFLAGTLCALFVPCSGPAVLPVFFLCPPGVHHWFGLCPGRKQKESQSVVSGHTFSAFRPRSSVVSVLISLISDISPSGEKKLVQFLVWVDLGVTSRSATFLGSLHCPPIALLGGAVPHFFFTTLCGETLLCVACVCLLLWCRKGTQKSSGKQQPCTHKTHKGHKSRYFLELCVSSLRRDHANLLCIVPILTDVPCGIQQGGGDLCPHTVFVEQGQFGRPGGAWWGRLLGPWGTRVAERRRHSCARGAARAYDHFREAW